MQNKLFTILSLLVVGFGAFAQSNNSSPYTRYAFGELNRSASAAYFGMASIDVPFADFNLVNASNPASYSFIARYKPVFNVGVNGRFLELSTTVATEKTNSFGLGEFSIGLPIGKKGGAAIGIMPVSTVGYKITDTDQDVNAGEVNYEYEGAGGINKVFIGIARKLVDKREIIQTDTTVYQQPMALSFGVNANYLFGSYTNTRKVDFTDATYLDSKVINSIGVSDFSFDGGLYYQQKFGADKKTGKKGLNITAGATFGIGGEVKAKQDVFVHTYRSFDSFEILEDTISYSGDVEGALTLPVSIGFGASVTYNNKLKFAFQYKAQDWSQYKATFGGVSSTESLASAYGVAVGLQYQPKSNYADQSNGAFKLARYRMGFRYDKTAILVSETQLDEIGMSFGLSVPMRNSWTSSMLNFGVELGKRGTTENNLIQERFVGLRIGLTITPGRFDNWFYKRKYD